MSRRNLLALAFYALLALLLTYPLVTQIADHVPGTATWSLDEYGYVWNNWWFKYAVFDRGTNPFFTNFLFYPLGTSLVLYAYTLLHVLLALPLQFAFGLVPAVNATVLFSFVAAAFGMYIFLRYLLRVSLRTWSDKYGDRIGPLANNPDLQTIASLLGGIGFAFTSNRFVYLSLGHYNIVASEWIPFYLLFLFKALLEGKRRNAVLAGMFAAFALYTESTDGVMIVLLTAVILVFEWRLLDFLVLKRTALIFVTLAVLFAPLLLPTLGEIFLSGYSLPGWGHSEKLLVDLGGFLTPTSLNPFDRHWESELDLVRQGISRFSDVNTFFVGYLTAFFALIGAIRFRRRAKLWAATVLIFAILCLGPLLHVNGVSEFDLDGLTTTVPLPFLLIHYIPLLKENRVPNRYSILATVGLAVLLSYAALWLMSNLVQIARNRGTKTRFLGGNERSTLALSTGALSIALALGSVIGLGLVLEHLATPLPLTDARVPDVYSQIGNQPGDFTILSVPFGWRNSFGQLGAEDTRTQYYQAVSGKFLLTGQIQRNPPILFDYFQRAPILSTIIAIETYNGVDPSTITRDREIAPEFVYFFDARYLVVNAAVPNRPPYSDTRAATLDYLQKVLPLGDKVYDRGGTVAYKINQSLSPKSFEIDFGTDAARLYEADGWNSDEQIAGVSGNWSAQQDSRVFIPIRQTSDYSITVRALPFEFPGHSQTLGLKVNGRSIAALTLGQGWGEYSFAVPANTLRSGLNELTWQFGYLVRPRDAVPPIYGIGQTGVTSPVDIAVQSNAEFGSIKVAGREVSPLKRGYNLAVIDPGSGAVIDVRNFDTGGSSILESRALTDFLAKLPAGAIVAGAVQQEAATSLGDRAAEALKGLGLRTDLRGTSGITHAFIAVKGRSGGLESTGEGSSLVSVGHSTDDRLLGVAFDWLRVTPK